MSIERVREYLRQYGVEDKILEFPVSSATVELAAAALGTEPGRIAKTLSFTVGEQPILIVAAGDARIELTISELENYSGYEAWVAVSR